MRTNEQTEKALAAVAVPANLSPQKAQLARLFAKEKLMEGFTVSGFCSDNGISTKSWYEYLEEADFKSYLNQVQSAIIPDSERDAYEAMKKHILKLAYKTSPTPKEVELFMETFSYIQEADKRERMEALGISDEKKPDTKTLEEKKASLLSRLTTK
ncbi:phBC6A51 family helix-turn-helix protein [Cytobacillus oceanisediminis]|uniref:phBC6A51 family helix-turn-helix protein n=1 Tax=Cytobacillus oceanisediminis TaxID=665099 RepID=UPI0023DA417D|nr:phBC6A51 family helix-turn-helix protein [Cytobacillus oceanisediminis]MDF2039864.1 phBC6A51 family helix-turn-helix protein [Cytobacillus oceanisediminis]